MCAQIEYVIQYIILFDFSFQKQVFAFNELYGMIGL